MLYGRARLLEALDVPRVEPASPEAPENLETGTLNHEGIVGAAAAVDFLASLGQAPGVGRRASLERAFARLHARGQALFERLWQGLRAIPGVTLYGPPPEAPRTPTVSFAVGGRTSDEVAKGLADRAVFASNGDFYASTVIARLGRTADGVVRAGCACYTTEDEVDRLVEGVREMAEGPRTSSRGRRFREDGAAPPSPPLSPRRGARECACESGLGKSALRPTAATSTSAASSCCRLLRASRSRRGGR